MKTKTMPGASIRAAPTMSILRRPVRSAWVISEGNEGVAEESECEQETGLLLGEAEAFEIEDEHDGDDSVAEKAEGTRAKSSQPRGSGSREDLDGGAVGDEVPDFLHLFVGDGDATLGPIAEGSGWPSLRPWIMMSPPGSTPASRARSRSRASG